MYRPLGEEVEEEEEEEEGFFFVEEPGRVRSATDGYISAMAPAGRWPLNITDETRD